MMKRWLIIGILVVLSGCASMQNAVVDVQQQETATVKQFIAQQRTHMAVLSPEIEFMKGYLGKEYQALPVTLVDAVRELQELAKQPDLTDDQVAYVLGLEMRVKSLITSEVGKKVSQTLVPVLGRDLIQALTSVGFLP